MLGKTYAAFFIPFVVVGCAQTAHKPSSNAAPDLPKFSVVSANEAFISKASNLSSIKLDKAMLPQQTSWVDFGKYKSLSLAVVNDVANLSRININSYVVQTEGGKSVLFYPLITLVSDEGAMLQTIKPESEFKFNHNILTNTFNLPANTKRFIIHTSPEYFQHTFAKSGRSAFPTPLIKDSLVNEALIKTPAVLADTKDTKKFSLSPVGVIFLYY